MPVTKITKENINEVVSESVLAHYPSNDDPSEEFFNPDDQRLEYYRITKVIDGNGDRFLTSVNYVNQEGKGQFVNAIHIDALVMQTKQTITKEELLDGKWWLIDIEVPPDSQ